jgi:hypothetical protein
MTYGNKKKINAIYLKKDADDDIYVNYTVNI